MIQLKTQFDTVEKIQAATAADLNDLIDDVRNLKAYAESLELRAASLEEGQEAWRNIAHSQADQSRKLAEQLDQALVGKIGSEVIREIAEGVAVAAVQEALSTVQDDVRELKHEMKELSREAIEDMARSAVVDMIAGGSITVSIDYV